MLVNIKSMDGRWLGQVRVKKFEDAIVAGSTLAGVVGEDVVLCDLHGRQSMVMTRAGQVKGGDDAGATAGSGDAGDDGHG